MKRGLVLTSLAPAANGDISVFEHAVKLMTSYGVTCFEFLCPPNLAEEYGEVLKKYKADGIFLLAAHQKKNGLWLCDLDDKKREKAIEIAKEDINAGISAGCSRFLVTSGRIPENGNTETAYRNLYSSLSELLEYIPKEYFLSLEPGDTSVDGFQLVGPTALAIKLARSLREKYINFCLTMDTSHLKQLNEDIPDALRQSAEVSNHLHIANCILKNGHPLYGDKHPFLTDPDAEISPKLFISIEELFKELNTHRESILSIEIIGRRSFEEDFRDAFAENELYLKMKRGLK